MSVIKSFNSIYLITRRFSYINPKRLINLNLSEKSIFNNITSKKAYTQNNFWFPNIVVLKYSTQKGPKETATYEEVKNLSKGTILIDVRELDELTETGKIPGSVNIPLGDVTKALSVATKPDQFQKLYGIEKPKSDTPIIFHCKSGKRSQTAMEDAKLLGFKNVRNYNGSWLEWAKKKAYKKFK